MKECLKKRLLLRSVFSKLIASFFLVIFVMSLFLVFSYKSYISSIEKEMTKNADERLNCVVSRLDTNFNQIKNTLLQIYMETDFLQKDKQGKGNAIYFLCVENKGLIL